MNFDELARSRRSIRGYKKDPVPRAVIEEIIEAAKSAPSSMNTQPWHVHVLTGRVLDEVRRTRPGDGGRGKNASAIFGKPAWARQELTKSAI